MIKYSWVKYFKASLDFPSAMPWGWTCRSRLCTWSTTPPSMATSSGPVMERLTRTVPSCGMRLSRASYLGCSSMAMSSLRWAMQTFYQDTCIQAKSCQVPGGRMAEIVGGKWLFGVGNIVFFLKIFMNLPLTQVFWSQQCSLFWLLSLLKLISISCTLSELSRWKEGFVVSTSINCY